MTITSQTIGKRVGSQEFYESYLVITDLDKSASINGPILNNRDGRVSAVFAQIAVDQWSGYKPQLRCRLLSGMSREQPYFSPLKDAHDKCIETIIVSMPTVLETMAPVSIMSLDTQHFSRCYFPPVLCLGIELTGIEAAWCGRVSVCVIRS